MKNKHKILSIGLTGGIGSGKSTAAKIFSAMDIPVYYSDKVAKKMLATNENIKTEYTKILGTEICLPDGSLDKIKIAELIFNDKEILNKINSLMWTFVKEDFDLWIEKQKAPYVVQESALLYESGTATKHNFVVTVDAPLELRIKRVMNRDKISRKEVLDRIKNQISQEEKNKLANFVVINDGLNLLLPQIMKLHKFFIKTSQKEFEN